MSRERQWRRIVESEKRPGVSRFEDYLAGSLDVNNISYRRQVNIATTGLNLPKCYLIDFLIEGKRVVEINSISHKIFREKWDRTRDAALRLMSYRVLRLENRRVQSDLRGCIDEISQNLDLTD